MATAPSAWPWQTPARRTAPPSSALCVLRVLCVRAWRRRTLLCVYQLHSAAINSLVMHQGLCVTGSDDTLLRVWPLDFADFLMEVSAAPRPSFPPPGLPLCCHRLLACLPCVAPTSSWR